MDFTEKQIKENTVYRGKILNLRNDEVALPNGNTSRREIVEHRGGACVLAVTKGRILLVRQFRYAYGEMLWEIPAGKLEANEDPLLAAEREVSEETGYLCKELKPYGVIYPTPGYSNEKIYIYRAEVTESGDPHPDPDEFVTAKLFEVETAWQMIESGEIKDAKTIVAIYRYLLDREKITSK